uniref:LIM zinc-binding domain-containing protein n=1 Tax=Caenorhabditis tropicalis TaxID=1561998 RepID=A0A1I7UTU5_9PELO
MVRITTTPRPWQSSGAGGTRIWRPEVTENTGPGQEHTPYRVNLQHSSDSRPPQGFNNSALPFETDQRVKHMQYNSPLGIYSDKSAAEQYVQQTQGLVENQGARAAAGRPDEPAYLRSETLRLLKEQESNGHSATTLSNHPNPSGLPVCFMCTRPILGVMARAAGKNLHGDCLSCATCGNSLRNVGHHFIEDKFYCDIHGTQRKAGGRPGMDPNIFVKSSPTAAQPVPIQENSPRAAYHPQINQSTRPLSVSPAPSAGSRQVTTHYHTPKTQGILSPGQRGVPTAAFGADLSKTVSYGGGVGPGGTHYDSNRLSPSPFSQSSRTNQQAPPPVPSNPPPTHESRVPDSVRSAVSPRRSGKVPRQWPPAAGQKTNRYWQIDPADALKKEKISYGEDLAALIREEQEGPGNPKKKVEIDEKRPEKLEKPVRKVENEPKMTEKPPKKAEKEPKTPKRPRRASQISKEQVQQAFEEHRKRQEPPKIQDGIHWTVIHSPPLAPPPGVLKPIPSYAQPAISKTATPQPFKPTPLPRSPQHSPIRSYIVGGDVTTVTDLQTTVTRQYTTLAPPPDTIDQSTSPIPSIRLTRHREPTVSSGTSPIKVLEPWVKIHEPTGPEGIEDDSKPYHEDLARMDQVGRPQPYKDYKTSLAPPTLRKDPKFKKVDFSKTSPTVIQWRESADIVDESDILTECSKDEDSISFLKAATYDGDESEMIDNDISTFDIEEEEEIIPQQKGRITVVGKGTGEAEKQWRQRAMELLDDDAQTERDLMIVAALNERLQGLREMEDDDRVRAIECIARHQSELEQTQTQLSTLLESAIVYLQNLRPAEDQETPEPTRAEERVQEIRKRVLEDLEQLPILGDGGMDAPPPPPERKVFPFQSYQPKIEERATIESPVTHSLHDVLDEFYSIRKPTPLDSAEDSRNFLAARLGHAMTLDERQTDGGQQGSSYSKTSFERTTTENRPVDTVGGARAGDFRGTGHLTTTTTQQQNGGRVPYCESCKQQIRGAFVLATGKSWCPEHFVCANSSCRRRLLECGFVEEDGQKFCETCFEQHIAPRCAKCSKPIVSDCLNALQKKWHPTCFTCAHCQKPFGNSAFYLEQGLPYCEQDWNALFTTKCVSCRYPIEAGDRWVEALGNAFHSNCFTCARCNHNLEGESFFAKNGQPFCRLHA